METQSGYVAIAGKPNVGKSTFLNHFLGEKLSITTAKPQTTRDKILGVYTDENIQLLFLDTPGIHQSTKEFNKFMISEAISAIKDGDVVLFFVEFNKKGKIDPINEKILQYCEKKGKKVILIINKIDKMDTPIQLIDFIKLWEKRYDFVEIIPISASKGFDKKLFLKQITPFIPKHPFYYPADYLTDKDDRFMVQEIVREKIFLKTNQEIPYDIAVTVERFKTFSNKIEIFVNIIVARNSQKGMVVGKGGKLIKSIGIDARVDIEKILKKKVDLKLFVKVEKNWNKKGNKLEQIGYKNSNINIDELF